ncbi:uncharacterized protein [Anabrus simplex]|uniref:uncharacterized protein n=1 Tax=Anabrus simplex TaxID=316456 RepID=UPI0035A2A7AE
MTPISCWWTVAVVLVVAHKTKAAAISQQQGNTTYLSREIRGTYHHAAQQRGDHDYLYDHHDVPPLTPPPPPMEQGKSDAVHSYYEFLINEGSYKFWAVFELLTAALLIYSAFAAVYYAKFTYATTDYSDYDDFFFKRSGDSYTTPAPQEDTFLGLSAATYQRILDAIASKKYS